MRKAAAFRGGANKTAPPCETLSENKYFPTVPVEQLERKTFLKVLLLEKTVFIVRQKGVLPLLLPTSVQQLPRCLVRICNLFHKGNQIANWKVSKKCNCSRENLLQNNLLRKCGLLAHTSAAFLKNCCTEKLFSLCSVCRKTMLLGKTVFHIRQKGVPPLLLPASVLQLPRCLVRICNLFHKGNQIANWKVSKKCNCSRENLLQNNLLRKCGLLAHTSAAFLKNCCTEKRFSCLRLDSYSQHANKFVS